MAGAVLGAGLGACGVPAPTPSSPPDPTAVPEPGVTPGPTSVFASDGPIQLELQLPRTTFSASEPVTGQGVLSTTDGSDAAVAGSGSGLITFTYSEIGGTRSMGGASNADCNPYLIAAGDPVTEQLTHSAGWSADDPNAVFYEAFAKGPDVRLPSGAWQITARATFLGPGCQMPEHDLSASTVIVVTP